MPIVDFFGNPTEAQMQEMAKVLKQLQTLCALEAMKGFAQESFNHYHGADTQKALLAAQTYAACVVALETLNREPSVKDPAPLIN